MEIIAHLYSKDINKCFDYSYSKTNNGVFSEIETPTNLKYCDKIIIKSHITLKYLKIVKIQK